MAENTLLILGLDFSVFSFDSLRDDCLSPLVSRLSPVFMRSLSMISILGVILVSAILLLVKSIKKQAMSDSHLCSADTNL
jgi:hypothetical protein